MGVLLGPGFLGTIEEPRVDSFPACCGFDSISGSDSVSTGCCVQMGIEVPLGLECLLGASFLSFTVGTPVLFRDLRPDGALTEHCSAKGST